jgi:hypothetical protein
MATCRELRNFTNAELSAMTHDELNKYSLDELIALANVRLNEAESKNDKSNPLFNEIITLGKLLLSTILVRTVQDTVDTTWINILKSLITALNQILNK